MVKKKLIKGLLSMIFFSGTASADLEWERKTVIVNVHPAQLKTVGIFKFRNKGWEPVEIKKIISSCSCLLPHLEKNRFAPGETGVLTVEFNLENRTGPQRKSLKVFTTDHSITPVILYVQTDIPVAYEIPTKMIFWNSSGELKSHICRLTNTSEVPVKLKPPVSSHPRIQVRMNTIKEGFEYEVIVTPGKKLRNARAVIRIPTQPPPGTMESRTYKLYAVIK